MPVVILVFGSINLDLVARVAALPGPGETVLSESMASYPGGKGANQALAARRAGAAVRMVGAVGRDGFAPPALALLREAGVDLSSVAETDAATGVALIAVAASGENQIVVASGANGLVGVEALTTIPFGPGDTLVLQRELRSDEVFAACRMGRARGARVVLNNAPSAPVPAGAWADIDVVVVNEHEAAALGEAADPETGAAIAAGVIVVTTLGEAGATARWRDSSGSTRQTQVAALPIRPVDTTGAGDCFVGCLAASLDRGDGVAEALRFATVAGSLACLVQGAQPSLPIRAAIEAATPPP